MFSKVFDFLMGVAMNGLLAVFVAALFYLAFGVLFSFVQIPVSIIAGQNVADGIETAVFTGNVSYRIIYAIVFISLMMEDLGILGPKGLFKRWKERRTVSAEG